MKTSPHGRAFIEGFEGLSLKAYWDGFGKVWTIGYGHTRAAGPPDVYEGMLITKDEADQIESSDLTAVELQVAHLVIRPINQNQADSLISFDFNTGGLARSSLLHAINNGLPVTEGLFTAWSHASGHFVPGLYTRRIAEWKLFNAPVVIS